MTDEAKQALIERQVALIQEYEQWESIQRDYSYDNEFYGFCQWKMNLLDEEAEQIRRALEMDSCEQ